MTPKPNMDFDKAAELATQLLAVKYNVESQDIHAAGADASGARFAFNVKPTIQGEDLVTIWIDYSITTARVVKGNALELEIFRPDKLIQEWRIIGQKSFEIK